MTEVTTGGPREIHNHKVNPDNDKLRIHVMDAIGSGGANHRYEITGFDSENYPTVSYGRCLILFQNGPIALSGVNGLTHEILLAIVIDRLRGFQYQRKEDGTFDFETKGKYSCKENAIALNHCEEALVWLKNRTRDRMERGVEGTHNL